MTQLKETFLTQKEKNNQNELEHQNANWYISPKLDVRSTWDKNIIIKCSNKATSRHDRKFLQKFQKGISSTTNFLGNSQFHFDELHVEKFTFLIYADLFHVKKAILESQFILHLANNWDDESAVSIPEEIWYRAINFLVEYCNYLHKIFKLNIDGPTISPCADGSIDLHFRNSNAQILFNFKNSMCPEVHFYGDELNNFSKFKGNFLTTSFQEIIVIWLKKFKIEYHDRYALGA